MKKLLPSLLLHLVLGLGALATLAPLLWMVSASFMSSGEANSFPPRLLPHTPTLSHYIDLFTRLDLARYFANSTLVATSATLISLLVNTLAGYAFAKLRFTGRERVFPHPARGTGHPGAGRHAAAVPAAQGDGPGQHADRRDRAVHGGRVRHLHDPAVLARHPE